MLSIEPYIASLQSPDSRRTMRAALQRVAGILGGGNVAWARLELADFQCIRAHLARHYSPRTGALCIAALRGLYRTALLTGEKCERQLELVRQLRIKGSRLPAGRALTDEEIRALIEAVKLTARPRGPLLRALLLIMLGTGLRRAEVCALRLSSLSAAGLRIIGKGNKERLAPLDRTTRDACNAWLRERQRLRPKHPYLFSFRGKPLSPDTLYNLFHSLAQRAGVAHFGVHDLRRTFASRLLAGGFSLGEVQVLMGHASIEMTTRYDRRTFDAVHAKRVAFNLQGDSHGNEAAW